MKQTTIRTVLLIAYWIPFAFLAMYGDCEYGTMWFYVFMVVELAVLGWVCLRFKCPEVILCGNLITTVSSYFCLQQMLDTEAGALWGGYFKPLSPTQMMFSIMALAVGIQLLYMHILKRRGQRSMASTSPTQPVKKSHNKQHKKRK